MQVDHKGLDQAIARVLGIDLESNTITAEPAALEAVMTGMMKKIRHKKFGSEIRIVEKFEGQNRKARRRAAALARRNTK